MTQQKYIYVARLHCQKNRASAALIVFVVVLSNCILLSIDKMSTVHFHTYGTFMLIVRKTILDEKFFYCSEEFKKWAIQFKIFHQIEEREIQLKAIYLDQIQICKAIIRKKKQETKNIFIDLETLATGMPRTHDYENQEAWYRLLVQQNNQEIMFYEMRICDYRKAHKIAFSNLGMSPIVGTALEEANVVLDKIRECEKEIDDLKKQEKDELEQQELIAKALRRNKTRNLVITDIEQVQELIAKALRKNKTREFVVIDIEVVQDPLSQ